MFVQITQPTSVHSISYRLLRFSIAVYIFFIRGWLAFCADAR